MGTKVVFIDKEPKTPKYKKNGTYTATTAKLLSEYFETEVNVEDTHLAGSKVSDSNELLRNKLNLDRKKRSRIGWEQSDGNPMSTTERK